MRQQTRSSKEPAEKVVQDIRRATRKHYSAEEKYGSFWKACAARTASLSCAAAKGSRRTFTIADRKTSWRLARSAWPAIRPGLPPRTRSSDCGARPRRSRRRSPI